MRKLLKVLFTCLVFIIVVLAIALAILLYAFDLNTLKPQLEQKVNAATGYHLVIDSKLSWSLLPTFAIQIPHLTITEPQQKTPFIDLTDVRIATSLQQFWHGLKNVTGNITIKEIHFMKMHLQDTKVNVTWQNDILQLKPITAKFYQGTLKANASVAHIRVEPTWQWEMQGNNIQVRDLLADLTGQKARLQLTGLAQMNMHGATGGNNKDELMNNLMGNVSLSMQKGTIAGVNLDFFVASADALINKQPLPAADNLKLTQFDRLSASAAIDKGIARTNDILLQSKTLMTQGQGTIDLIKQTLDLKLIIKPQQQIKSQYEIPITISGPLSDPNINADMRDIEDRIARQVMDQLKGKVEDNVIKFLGH